MVLAAGCSAITGEVETTRDLKLVNQDDADHAVVVEISNKSGLVYSDGRTIGAESGLNLKQFENTGEYSVLVAVDGERTETTHTFEPEDRPIPVTNIGIDNDGQVTIE